METLTMSVQVTLAAFFLMKHHVNLSSKWFNQPCFLSLSMRKAYLSMNMMANLGFATFDARSLSFLRPLEISQLMFWMP